MRQLIASAAILSLPAFALGQTTRPLPQITADRPAARQPVGNEMNPKQALARRIADVKLIGIPLDAAIDYVREVSGANVHVNWRALEQINVTRQTSVSLRLADVTARRILRGILDETGAGDLITYYIDEGVIEITTREIADNQMITRVYPVNDLVMSVPNFEGPSFNLQSQGGQTSGKGGGGGGGGGQSLFGGGSGTSGGGGPQDTPASNALSGQQLVKLITDTVRPEVWRDNGGTASIRYFNGHLIVTAPRSVQEAIGGRP